MEKITMHLIRPIPGAGTARSLFAASGNIILALVALVVVMDMLVYSIIIPVLPAYTLMIGADESALGIIFGVYPAMMFLFSVPIGLLSDRVGRLPLLVSGMALLSVATFIFGFSTTVPLLMIARAVQGISAAATWSAGLALLADVSAPSELGERMGITLSMMGIGTVLGPVIGGLLFETVGYTLTFLIPSLLAGLIGLLILIVPFPIPPPAQSLHRSILPASGLPRFALYAAVIIAVSGTYGLLEPYLPVYLAESFAASPITIGIVIGALALTGSIFQPVVGRIFDRHGGRALIGSGLILSGLVLIAAMQPLSLVPVAVIVSLLGVTLALALVPVMPLLAGLYRSQGSQGVAYGIFNTLFSVGLAAGPFAGAVLVTAVSLPAIFIGHALLLMVAGVAGYAVMTSGHEQRT
jgi:MFS transporter, DHA1 family, multidrug resistance protein